MEVSEEKIKLVNFDKDNIEHVLFLKNLINDETIKSRFQGLLPNLMKNSKEIFNKGFFLSFKNELVGYIDFSSFNTEEAVYFRGAISQEHRGKKLGKKMLKDISNYTFENYPYVKFIKLKIEKDNISSIKVALSNGFYNIDKDYYVLENPNYKIKTL